MHSGDDGMTPAADEHTVERRRLLRGSIKLLVSIGFVFLLIPFFKSLPWPETAIPADSTFLRASNLHAGVPLAVTLRDQQIVFVTRNDAAVKARLQARSADDLWFPSAPGLLEQEYLVVQATSPLDETVTYLPPQGDWPGGYTAPSGAVWDVAGRALKPVTGHPTAYAMKVSNLMPAPWRTHDEGVLLMPLPQINTPVPGDEE